MMDGPMMTDTPLSINIYQEAIYTPLPDSPSLPPLVDTKSTESDYASIIHFLSSFMPHLRKAAMPVGIHNHASIDLYDYTSDGLKATEHHKFDGPEDAPAFRHKVMGNISADTRLRLIVVEDLSVKIISLLGGALQMSPEFFEEHLINSGWSGSNSGDFEADTWNTRGASKDYASIKWYRPVQPVERWDNSSDLSVPLASRASLLTSPGLASRRSVNPETFPQMQTDWISKVNIMRRDWDLGPQADPDGLGRNFSAWEERVTIWHKQLDGCVLGTQIERIILAGH